MRLCLLLTAHDRKLAFTISALSVNRLTEKVNVYSFSVFLLRQLVNFAKILRRQVTGRLRMSSKNSIFTGASVFLALVSLNSFSLLHSQRQHEVL